MDKKRLVNRIDGLIHTKIEVAGNNHNACLLGSVLEKLGYKTETIEMILINKQLVRQIETIFIEDFGTECN